MLKHLTLCFVGLCLLGGVYEYFLRDSGLLRGKRVLSVGAEGWQIVEFKLHEQIERFNREHPDLRVELHQLPSGYETQIMLQSTSDELVYDLLLPGNNYNVDRYYVRGLISPAGQMAGKEFESRIITGMLRGAQVAVPDQGRVTYLAPFMGEVEVLNYRKDLFAQAGLTRPPETWQEFEEYADKLKAAGGSKYAVSMNVEQGGFFLQNTFLVLLQSLRGRTTEEGGRLAIVCPESAEAFRLVKRWWKKGLLSPACRNPQGAADDFKMGLTAMYPNWQSRGMWALRNEKLADKIAFAPLPEAKKVGSLICVYGGAVLKKSRVQKEAIEFMTGAMCGYGQVQITAAGKMPVTRDAYKPGLVPDWMIEVAKTMENGYTAPDPLHFFDLSESMAVAFHNFLKADSDDPLPFLQEAQDDVQRRVYSRGEDY